VGMRERENEMEENGDTNNNNDVTENDDDVSSLRTNCR